jgi:hypothetical protein
MEVVVGREVRGLLGCGDEIYESASPGDDLSKSYTRPLEFIVEAS